jgi:hypothetical protein
MNTHPMPHRRIRLATAAFTLVALAGGIALAGCSATSHSGASTSANAPAAAPAGAGKAAAPEGNRRAATDQTGQDATGQTGQQSKPGAPALPVITQRSIIHTGQITLRVRDVDIAAAQMESYASSAGGYVGGDNRTINGNQSVATVTLRVPADRFDAAMTAIDLLGTEQNRTVSTQDVTNQVIDVAARLKSQQASVDRIRALLAQAKTIAEIVSIESELTQREADLESLEAQQANLGDLTALSTITATLLGPQAHAVVAKKTKPAGFIGGVKGGWHAFVAVLVWLLMVIGAILPFAVLIGLVAWLARRLQRRIQARRVPAIAGAASIAGETSGPGET